MPNALPNTPQTPLGIIAGQGSLPAKIIAHCKANNRPCFVLGFEGNIAAADLQHVPHRIIRFGAIGDGLEYFRNAQVTDLVLAGDIKRPSFMQLKPDADGARLLKRLSKAIFGGDDALLRELVGFLEDEKFSVLSITDILGELGIEAGVFGKHAPSPALLEHITKGYKALQSIGMLDIGQALVIENGYVLGVEAAEGTDALIERCAPLMKERDKAILVKGAKPQQETRVDMPTIGQKTIELLAKHHYAGVALEAHATMVVDADEVRKKADKFGLFVYAYEVHS